MNTNRTIRTIAIAAASGILIALSLSGVAKAITDTVFRYSAPKTGYLSLHMLAFSPQSALAADHYAKNWLFGTYTAQADNVCGDAAIDLPQGATITGAALWYTGDVWARLVRQKLSDGTLTLVAYTEFSGTPTGTRAARTLTVADTSAIDNVRYAYGLEVCLNNGYALHAARVQFTYNTAGY